MSRLNVALMRDPQWRAYEDRVANPVTATPSPVTTVTSGTMARPGDLREFASAAAAEVISRLLGRERAQWRRALEGVRSALDALEHASDSAGPGHSTELEADISDLVSGIVATAATESTAAADRARAEARAINDELEARLARLEVESQNTLALAAARQQEEQALRVRAEEARAACERIHDEVVASYQSQIEAAKLRTESERLHFATVREQLAACLEQAVRVVHGPEAAAARFSPALGPEPQHSRVPVADVVVRTGDPLAAREPGAKPGKAQTTSPPAHEAAPDIFESIQHSLKEIEAAYWAEITVKSPLEALNLLTARLRATRAQLPERFESRRDIAATLFQDQLMVLLNARGDTSYGRHLSIAVRELYPVQGSTAASAKL